MNPADSDSLREQLEAQASAIQHHEEQLTSIMGVCRRWWLAMRGAWVLFRNTSRGSPCQTVDWVLCHPPVLRSGLLLRRKCACPLQNIIPVLLVPAGHSLCSVPLSGGNNLLSAHWSSCSPPNSVRSKIMPHLEERLFEVCSTWHREGDPCLTAPTSSAP